MFLLIFLLFHLNKDPQTAMPWRKGGGLDYSFKNYKSLLLVK